MRSAACETDWLLEHSVAVCLWAGTQKREVLGVFQTLSEWKHKGQAGDPGDGSYFLLWALDLLWLANHTYA